LLAEKCKSKASLINREEGIVSLLNGEYPDYLLQNDSLLDSLEDPDVDV